MQAIHFTDGTILYLTGEDNGIDLYVTAVAEKPKRKGATQ